ncbi:MAG: glycosyltransferase [Terracidiphilus sp.]|jgi:glycosyltransferase involved in cell wall biosynthesis
MLISIVMPAYNAERFLAEAIKSVLAQTWIDFELIILDDGSEDHTREIALRYAQLDSRVRVKSHANIGVAATLNQGMALAASEWVVVMHADDVMMPNRLECQLAFVTAHPELAVASSWIKHIDSEGRVIGKGESPLVTHEAVRKLFVANELVGFSHPAAILRKSAVLAVGGYSRQLRVNEDIDLWNRMLEHGYKILVQPEYLLKYRIHGSSASIAKARLILQQLRWIKECMLRRRSGQAELSWEDYLRFRRTLPWRVRANATRKDLAKVLYKAATYHFAQRRYYLVAPTVIAAVILQPGYTIPQIAAKMVLRRS